MVSTRQSSNVGGGGENSGAVSESGQSKSVKHTSAPCTSLQDLNLSGSPVFFNSERSLSLFDLPVEILEKILEYLGYKSISHLRLVCHKMDSICSGMLNSTFQRLQTQMLSRFQSIKAKMPRRESARRNHPLACESDIIETLHMRLTLLQMTFGKHIERKHCCFFAGEILDEVYRILHYIRMTPVMTRPYKVTDELFDLSTMAMEYFKEHIEPTLPEINYFSSNFLDFHSSFGSTSKVPKYLCIDSASPASSKGDDETPSGPLLSLCGNDDQMNEAPPQSNMVLRKRIRKIKQGMKRYNSQLSLMRRDLKGCKNKIADQQKQILDYAGRLDENDKKNEETSRKFSTLLQELNKCKTELQYWRSKSPANPLLCIGCGKVVAPALSEDLQALSNQGILPEGLEVPSVDFVPIAGTSNGNESLWDTVSQQHDEVDAETSGALLSSPGSVATSTPATTLKGSNCKRKGSEDVNTSEIKKPRRMSKSRTKRSKIL